VPKTSQHFENKNWTLVSEAASPLTQSTATEECLARAEEAARVEGKGLGKATRMARVEEEKARPRQGIEFLEVSLQKSSAQATCVSSCQGDDGQSCHAGDGTSLCKAPAQDGG
jgi:hypothetical protein